MLTAIIAPNEAVENVFRLYRLEKKDGTLIEGFKRSENAGEMTLILMGGVETKIPLDQVRAAGYIQNKSMMADITANMTVAQVAAIAAYLQTVK
jgi:putative heme-binding domain-containing protein